MSILRFAASAGLLALLPLGCSPSPGHAAEAGGPATAHVSDRRSYPTPEFVVPEKGKPFEDPTFGTRVVRLSSKAADRYEGEFMAPQYATMPLVTADGAKVLLGTYRFYWYDPVSYRNLGPLSPGLIHDGRDPEVRLDPEVPGALYYRAQTRFYRYGPEGGSKLLHDFADEFPEARRIFSDGQGDPSADGRYWAFQVVARVEKRSELLDVVVYDRQQDRIVSRMSENAPLPRRVRWVSMAPSGRRVLVKYWGQETLPGGLRAAGVVSFKRDFTDPVVLRGATGHSDRALTADGREVLVYQNNVTDYVCMADLETGVITNLIKIDFSKGTPYGFHFSGNNYERPGWALVSTYVRENLLNHPHKQWMVDSIFLVELERHPRVVRIAHTYNVLSDRGPQRRYRTEPHANIDRAGHRVVWAANGYDPEAPVDVYMAELPEGLWDSLAGKGSPPRP